MRIYGSLPQWLVDMMVAANPATIVTQVENSDSNPQDVIETALDAHLIVVYLGEDNKTEHFQQAFILGCAKAINKKSLLIDLSDQSDRSLDMLRATANVVCNKTQDAIMVLVALSKLYD